MMPHPVTNGFFVEGPDHETEAIGMSLGNGGCHTSVMLRYWSWAWYWKQHS